MNKHGRLDNEINGVGDVELVDRPDRGCNTCSEIEKTNTECEKDKTGDELDLLFLPAGETIVHATLLATRATPIQVVTPIFMPLFVRQSTLACIITNVSQPLDYRYVYNLPGGNWPVFSSENKAL